MSKRLARLTALAAFTLLAPPPGAAHEWFSRQCCSDKDCMVIPPEAVQWLPEGWKIVKTGEVIPHNSDRLHETPPEGGGQYGWCRRLEDVPPSHLHHGFKKDETICLYVPPGGV